MPDSGSQQRHQSPPPLPQLPDIPVLTPTRFDGLLGAASNTPAAARVQQNRPNDAGLFGERQQQPSQQSDAQQVQGDAKRSSASRKQGGTGLFG
jgi:hypothetical protein